MADKGKPQGPFPKKPKLSKAEMRAKQERQRAEKAARLGQTQAKKKAPNNKPAPNANKSQKKNSGKRRETVDENQVQLFAHLQQYEDGRSQKLRNYLDEHEVPPCVIRLGLKYANWSISGSNARCIAMLATFKQVIEEYVTPPGKSLHRDLELFFRPCIEFLSICRPKSISMGNAITYIKKQISKTAELSDEKAKISLLEEIDRYIKARIDVSQFIAKTGNSKIVDGDVVLTYSNSTSVAATIKLAKDSGKSFKVIVVDSRPTFEGRSLLKNLVAYGLECCYVTLNAISFIMTEVTKVFLGAFAMLTNGNLISRAGTAAVAMMAHRFNIPVMVCCETYKFVERAQLDSICFNELGDPDALVSGAPAAGCSLADWKTTPNLKLLNLNYDLTPIEFLSVVITEFGMIPPTSVPVILREQNTIEADTQ
mmetsp:Transcript_128753/g.191900  ORF Transcript_128753/g.191900 Transcript_128753/m.191900 type:complete len:425 (-) Transcript_128753:14-1288(-)